MPFTPADLLEAAAFALALGYVLLSIRQVHWAWPLAAASSVLYGLLFAQARLYGQVALQAFFFATSLWGWWQWRHGRKDDRPLALSRLPRRLALALAAAWGGATLLLALLLGQGTDAASPWLDAFTTAGSAVGQILVARKYPEAWLVWIGVNAISVVLFAQQGLGLTALLYALLLALSVVGWRRWDRDTARC